MARLFRNMMNRIMKPLLNSRLHFLASGWCMLITVQGRKTGNFYTTPVYYHREGDTLHFVSGKAVRWVRNLEGGAPVTLRLRGKLLRAHAHTCPDGPVTVQTMQAMYPWLKEKAAENSVMVEVELIN